RCWCIRADSCSRRQARSTCFRRRRTWSRSRCSSRQRTATGKPRRPERRAFRETREGEREEGRGARNNLQETHEAQETETETERAARGQPFSSIAAPCSGAALDPRSVVAAANDAEHHQQVAE